MTIYKTLFINIALLFAMGIFAQKPTVSGYVRDVKSGEALIGATVFCANSHAGTVTNTYGFYALSVPQTDTVGLIVSYVGYQAQGKNLIIRQNTTLDFSLSDVGATLNEVTVSAKKNADNVMKAKMGVIDVPIRLLQSLPAIAGEKDILKVIQLLPGVQAGGEGTTGFYVRGGSIDQNLVLLDEATIYNPSHLFGLFSTFNTRAINNVTLVKGGFGAQYGGRLSSILDITMKEGNNQTFHTEGGIGLISAQLTAEGPIQKGKGSFIVSARRSYLDLLARPFMADSNRTSYYFYDLNMKANYQITVKDKLFLSLFKGRDKANYTGSTSLNYGIDFGNSTATLRWNRLFSKRLFANTSLIYNDYNINLSTTQSGYLAQIYSGVRDINAKTDFTFYASQQHTFKIGANYIDHVFTPISASAKLPATGQIATIRPDTVPKRYAREGAIYLSDDIDFSNSFSMNIGGRLPFFYGNGGQYLRFEPRLTLKQNLDPTTSIKASYTEMNQFLHLVASSAASLPTDVWVPSSGKIQPQVSRQAALGLFKNFANNEYETSVETYYKTMEQQALFKEGTRLTEQLNYDQSLTFGKGWSYGAEFFVKKNTGRMTGWVSYTLSWTNQQFPELNSGLTFPATFDRRHNLSIVGDYKLSERWSVAADFVFTTGGAFNLPVGRVAVADGATLFDGYYADYSGRNNYRYNNYHRLDVNFVYKKQHLWRGKKRWESEWNFGAYNIYSRLNPYFIYLSIDPQTSKPTATQVSLLPIIPNINWNFKF